MKCPRCWGAVANHSGDAFFEFVYWHDWPNTRLLSVRLTAAGIAHRYEEFEDNHSDIDYRMDTSLPWLYRALTT